ncbi:MAG: tetratricopeptide repeat protein [Mailhella sp.]|nr:tetratricopeptide repeat protein [Mailhella sp.]
MTDSSRRIVLCALLLGIAVMLAASVAWRLDGKPLVHDHGSAATAQAPAQMPPAQPAPGTPDKAKMEQAAQSPQAMAIMGLMQKMKENPNDVETLLALAQTFAEQGDTEGAKDMIQRATVAAPSDHRPPYLMGVVLGGQGKWQEAAEQLERSVALKDDASARYSLGVIWRYHLKDDAKARPHFEAAARLNGDPSLASMIKAELDKAAGTK